MPSTLSTYRINNTNGATCILIRTDALLSVSYRDKLGEDKELGKLCFCEEENEKIFQFNDANHRYVQMSIYRTIQNCRALVKTIKVVLL